MTESAFDIANGPSGMAGLVAYWITQPVLNRTTYLSYQTVSLLSSAVAVAVFVVAARVLKPHAEWKTLLEAAALALGFLLLLDLSVCVSFGTCGRSMRRTKEDNDRMMQSAIASIDGTLQMMKDKLKK